jgi:hypothetical protein
MNPTYQVIRGGRVLDTERRSTDNADIVIAGDPPRPPLALPGQDQ